MKNVLKRLQFIVVFLLLLVSIRTIAQTQEEMMGYNGAYVTYYQNGNAQGAMNILNQYLAFFEGSPGYWLGDQNHIGFVFKVYRLANTILVNSGNSYGADQYLERLVYLMSNVYYEDEVINYYNNTPIVPY